MLEIHTEMYVCLHAECPLSTLLLAKLGMTSEVLLKLPTSKFTSFSCIQLGKQADTAILTEGCECT
jgi:hypothetical protein